MNDEPMNDVAISDEGELPEISSLPPHLLRRSAARLGAVMVLFRHEGDVEQPIPELVEDLSLQLLQNQQDMDEEGLDYEPDMAFLRELCDGVVANEAALDMKISEYLSKEWRFDRLDPVLRAILRAGTFELLHMPKTPFKVVLNEYVEVAKAFTSEEEARFINGLMDRLAKAEREDVT